MKAWYGIMDWPLDTSWKCEICGSLNLLWGLAHGTCRCEICHTQYRMRDEKDKIVTIPICQLKKEYYQPAKKLYQKLKIPMTQWTDKQWDEAISEKVNNSKVNLRR